MKQISHISVKHSVEAVLNASSILDQLPSITVPTIVATGEDDREFPLFMSQEIHQRSSHQHL